MLLLIRFIDSKYRYDTLQWYVNNDCFLLAEVVLGLANVMRLLAKHEC